MHPSLVDCTDRVDAHLLISHDLSDTAFHKGEVLPLSLCSICDSRQISQLESILVKFRDHSIHMNRPKNLELRMLHT